MRFSFAITFRGSGYRLREERAEKQTKTAHYLTVNTDNANTTHL